MLTLSDSAVWKELREIAIEAYPDVRLKPFSVSIEQRESRSVHGDYHPVTCKIRIFNLSRKTAHIVKTTIHELAHHVDCCVRGKSGHDKPFYVIYKRLLEVAHEMGKIDISDTSDEIDARDLSSMKKQVGAPSYGLRVVKEGYLLKALNAFDGKELLKSKGFVFSPTEKAWVGEYDTKAEAESALSALKQSLPKVDFRMGSRDENEIESVYFAILGLAPQLYAKRDELKADGWKFDKQKGWYKKIAAKDTDAITSFAKKRFGVVPKMTGKW